MYCVKRKMWILYSRNWGTYIFNFWRNIARFKKGKETLQREIRRIKEREGEGERNREGERERGGERERK